MASSGCISAARGPHPALQLELEAEPVLAVVCQELPLRLRLRNTTSIPIALVWRGSNSLAEVPSATLEWSVIAVGDFSWDHRPGRATTGGRRCFCSSNCDIVEPRREEVVVLKPGGSYPVVRGLDLDSSAKESVFRTLPFSGPDRPCSHQVGTVRVMAYFRVGYIPDATHSLTFAEDGHLVSTSLLATANLRSNEISLRVVP